MKNNLLNFLVPVYGKDPKKTFENLRNIATNIPKEIGMVIVYKNSSDNSLNYDDLKTIEEFNDNVKVIKAESNFKRTKKLKIAFENSESHYFMVLDAHHSLDINNLTK